MGGNEEEEFELGDTEHYIIEEYVEEYEDPEEYETVYVETVSGDEDEGKRFSGSFPIC